MKKICLLLIVCLLTVASVYGRQQTEVEKSVEPFSVVNIVGGLDVVFEQGSSYQVRLVGGADEVKSVNFKVVGGSLNLQVKNNSSQSFGDVYVEMAEDPKVANVTVYVTAPDVKSFNLAGSGTLRAETISSKSVVFNLAGSGQINIKRLSASNASFNLAGSGSIDLDNLKAKAANLTVSGSGSLKAYVDDASSLSCSTIGTGSISVSGKADTYAKSTIGSSSINDSALKYGKKKESNVSDSVRYKGVGVKGFVRSRQPRVVDGIVVNP